MLVASQHCLSLLRFLHSPGDYTHQKHFRSSCWTAPALGLSSRDTCSRPFVTPYDLLLDSLQCVPCLFLYWGSQDCMPDTKNAQRKIALYGTAPKIMNGSIPTRPFSTAPSALNHRIKYFPSFAGTWRHSWSCSFSLPICIHVRIIPRYLSSAPLKGSGPLGQNLLFTDRIHLTWLKAYIVIGIFPGWLLSFSSALALRMSGDTKGFAHCRYVCSKGTEVIS